MTEAMKSFIEKLGKDEALQNKLKACKSPEEAFEVAKGAVDGLSFDEFTSTMKKLNESITKNKGELSDDDLEQVAGGWSDDNTVTVVTATIGAAGPAAAAAI
ncbi:Nif11-like leader peptide family RiPP precursor [Desulfoscipio sp. XC116]|uniref:Nif11-like leader peptide family RiPP precursor n=1 Tax=Desulfoscipio sp. XC116 TaxID=3144975 RepID=UPI00325BFBD5